MMRYDCASFSWLKHKRKCGFLFNVLYIPGLAGNRSHWNLHVILSTLTSVTLLHSTIRSTMAIKSLIDAWECYEKTIAKKTPTHPRSHVSSAQILRCAIKWLAVLPRALASAGVEAYLACRPPTSSSTDCEVFLLMASSCPKHWLHTVKAT